MASTSGRPSTPERRRRSSPAAAAADSVVLIRAGDALAAEIIAALKAGDVSRMKKFDKGLRKDGSSLLEAVAAAKPPAKAVVDSLLHLAARLVLYEPCKYLIKDLKLDTNAPGEYGQTPMISAIDGFDSANTSRKMEESVKILELLIRRGADPNKPKPDGFAPLHAATMKDSLEIVKLLLAKGAQVNAMCPSGTVLHIAAERGTGVSLVKLLLDGGVDPNLTNVNGFTALHVAAMKDSHAVAKLLLEKKVEVDAICDKGTALLMACETGASVAIVRLLLDHGADANKTNKSGFAGLHFATLKDSYDVAKLLLGKRADVDAVCEEGTALHIAAGRGSLKLLILLLQNEADADISDTNGRKPVEVAASKGFKECVVQLFPCTSPILNYADWSVDGIMHDAKNQNLG